MFSLSTPATLFFLLLCAPYLSFASHPRAAPNPLWRRSSQPARNVPPAGFWDPRSNGGEMLTVVAGTFPPGLQEPLNAIISGFSDEAVLVDQTTDGGLRNYFNAIGFSSECLGQHLGSDQGANLGDGNGILNETAVIRWDYGDASLGTCTESVDGGNHFRYWVQDGPKANSGAIFLGVSYELPAKQEHDIIFNGYNLARDWLVGNATAQPSLIPTSTVTNASFYSGNTSFGGYTYQTNVSYVSGLLPNTSNGINHYLTVGANDTNAVDGLVAVLNVKIVARPASSDGRITVSTSWHLPHLFALVALLHVVISSL